MVIQREGTIRQIKLTVFWRRKELLPAFARKIEVEYGHRRMEASQGSVERFRCFCLPCLSSVTCCQSDKLVGDWRLGRPFNCLNYIGEMPLAGYALWQL